MHCTHVQRCSHGNVGGVDVDLVFRTEDDPGAVRRTVTAGGEMKQSPASRISCMHHARPCIKDRDQRLRIIIVDGVVGTTEKEETVLEYGCGNGRILRHFKDFMKCMVLI